MRCRKAERWLLLSVDGRLDDSRGKELEAHLRACPACARAFSEYREMFGLLRSAPAEEPRPLFWERLQPRMAAEKSSATLLLWERWCLRAIPAFLGLAMVIGTALILLAPPAGEPMAASELLLRDQNPVTEASTIFEQGRGEARHMELLFAAAGETELQRKMP
jgi:anti-sigma factor RsiW